MLKRLSLQFGKSKQNTRKLWERQHKASPKASAVSLSSFLKRVVTDAEQIAASIKTKAQTEAEDEAARIISQARQEAEEIKRKAEIAARKGAAVPESLEVPPLQGEVAEEETEQPVQIQAEVTEEEMKQPAQLQEEVIEEKVKQPAQLQEEVAEEKVKQPAQVQEEVAVSEPVGVTTGELSEQHTREKKPARKAAGSAPLKQDSQALYTGEVELAISVPVDLKMVSKLYNYLQTIPEIKVIHTTGTWDRGTTITVGLDKPMPLISIISKIGGIKAIPELPEKDSPEKEKLGLLLGKKKGGAKRIRLTPK